MEGGNGVKGDETQITNTTLYRFRLSYDDLDFDKEIVSVDEDGNGLDAGGNIISNSMLQFEITGADQPAKVDIFEDAETAYQAIAADTTGTKVAYIPSTGEIVFGEAYYNDPLKVNENMQVRVKYSKSTWEEGDINPVHYFHCIESNEQNAQKAMDLEQAQKDLVIAQGELEKAEADKNTPPADLEAAQMR